jgi:hypothetical protein
LTPFVVLIGILLIAVIERKSAVDHGNYSMIDNNQQLEEIKRAGIMVTLEIIGH